MYICSYNEEEKVTNLNGSGGAWQEFEGEKGWVEVYKYTVLIYGLLKKLKQKASIMAKCESQ